MTHANAVYLVLNKPRGLVTTARDERGRDTVYRCFDGAGLPWLAPVGRLDKASEGLLLFCNDPAVGRARSPIPATGPDKTYHVQVDRDSRRGAARGAGRRRRRATANACARSRRRCCARANATRGWKSCWTKAATGRSAGCWRRSISTCCDWCAWRSAPLALGDLPKGAWRLLTRGRSRRAGGVAEHRNARSAPSDHAQLAPDALTNASIARSRCSRVCAALTSACGCAPGPSAPPGRRSRSRRCLPRAGAARTSAPAARRTASPGMIGCTPGLMSKPAAVICSRK